MTLDPGDVNKAHVQCGPLNGHIHGVVTPVNGPKKMGRWGYITPDPEIEEAPVTSIVKQFMKVCHDSSLEQTVKLLIQISYLPFLLPTLTCGFFFRG